MSRTSLVIQLHDKKSFVNNLLSASFVVSFAYTETNVCELKQQVFLVTLLGKTISTFLNTLPSLVTSLIFVSVMFTN